LGGRAAPASTSTWSLESTGVPDTTGGGVADVLEEEAASLPALETEAEVLPVALARAIAPALDSTTLLRGESPSTSGDVEQTDERRLSMPGPGVWAAVAGGERTDASKFGSFHLSTLLSLLRGADIEARASSPT